MQVQVNARFAADVVTQLTALAKRLGVSRNTLIEAYVIAGLEGVASPLCEEASPSPPPASSSPDSVSPTPTPPLPPKVVTEPGPVDSAPETRMVDPPPATLRVVPATSREVTRGHLHRLVEVERTRGPGRLLGTTEATFECVCGKSERRKVS